MPNLQPVCAAAFMMCLAVSAGAADMQSITVSGVERQYVLFIPRGVSARHAPAAVVMALHGGKGTAGQLQSYFELDTVAERESFIAVYPQGVDNAWNDGREPMLRGNKRAVPGDDVTFLKQLADKLVQDGIADRKRLYLTGVSNGGFMTMKMACLGDAPFTAYAPIIASVPLDFETACHWQQPLPLLMINGTADPLVRYDGGKGWFGLSGNFAPPALAQLIATHDECGTSTSMQLADRDANDTSTVEKTVWTACAAGSAVELYTVQGGGHQPPVISDRRSGWLAGKLLGVRNHDIDAAETVWAFFKKFSR